MVAFTPTQINLCFIKIIFYVLALFVKGTGAVLLEKITRRYTLLKDVDIYHNMHNTFGLFHTLATVVVDIQFGGISWNVFDRYLFQINYFEDLVFLILSTFIFIGSTF